MQDSRTTATMAVTALVLALGAMLAGPAQARLLEGPSGGGGAATANPLNQRGVELLAENTAASEIQDRNLTATAPAVEPTIVVPYLSHGVGVDSSAFRDARQTARYSSDISPTIVVPYVSQGIGVDSSLFEDVVQTARHNSGWYTGLEYPDLPGATFGATPSASDDDFEWGPVGVGVGAAGIALLLAMTTVLAMRRQGRLAH